MIENKCIYFEKCGGCQIQGLTIQNYCTEKQNQLLKILGDLPYDEMAPMQTFPSGIRRKATLKVDYGCNIGFYKFKSNDVVPINKCPLLRDEINALIHPLKKLFKSFVKRSEGGIVITSADNGLCIHFENIALMPTDTPKIRTFAEEHNVLRITSGNVEVYKQAEPIIIFNGTKIPYPPKTFLQPTKESEQKIVDAVLDVIRGKHFKTSADIFCGLGLFSFYLRDFSDTVFAYDCDEDAIKHLAKIAHSNHFNIMAKSVDLFKHPLSTEKLNEFDFIVLDPPRDGAKAQCLKLRDATTKTVVYISCNPVAFTTDAKILINGGYRIKKITPIDQFPNTTHLELVAVFERN